MPTQTNEQTERRLTTPIAATTLPHQNRILLVKLSSLGDVVHALPLLEALRAAAPQAFTGWAVRSKFADLLLGNLNLSALYPLSGSQPGDVLALGKTLKSAKFDITLDAQGLFVSGLVTYLSGAKRRIGLDANREGNRLFLTDPIVPAKQRAHMVDKLLGFCDVLEIPRLAPRPQKYLAQANVDAACDLLSRVPDGPRVGCIVGASTPEKAYPTARWVELARLLSDQGMNVVLLGGGSEKQTAETIVQEARGAVAANLVGLTPLRTLGSVLARCQVVIGGDSGPTHLAVAVGTPVVGLYGVTDPVRTGPNWSSVPTIVLDYAEKDAPPESRRPRHSTLPDALSRIPAPDVAKAVVSLIQ